jgi:putative Mn2+ efflux pump MntP
MWKNISIYFGVLMVLIYFAAGLFVILSTTYFQNFLTYQRDILGGIIFAYGIFRLYKVIKTAKENEDDEDEQ